MKFFYNFLCSLFFCVQFFASDKESSNLSAVSIKPNKKNFIALNKQNVSQASAKNRIQRSTFIKLELDYWQKTCGAYKKKNHDLRNKLSSFNQQPVRVLTKEVSSYSVMLPSEAKKEYCESTNISVSQCSEFSCDDLSHVVYEENEDRETIEDLCNNDLEELLNENEEFQELIEKLQQEKELFVTEHERLQEECKRLKENNKLLLSTDMCDKETQTSRDTFFALCSKIVDVNIVPKQQEHYDGSVILYSPRSEFSSQEKVFLDDVFIEVAAQTDPIEREKKDITVQAEKITEKEEIKSEGREAETAKKLKSILLLNFFKNKSLWILTFFSGITCGCFFMYWIIRK